MDEFCLLCQQPLHTSSTVVVSKGIDALKRASIIRHDGLHEIFSESITLHVDCRKKYTHPSALSKIASTVENEYSEPPKKVLRSCLDEFDFKTHCLFCGELANINIEKKKAQQYRKSVHEVRTLEIKDTIRKHAMKVSNNTVLSRIDNIIDLVAAECKYHGQCYASFLKTNADESSDQSVIGRPEDTNSATGFSKLCKFIYENNECQYSMNELYAKLKEMTNGECYTEKHLQRKLKHAYYDKIAITHLAGKSNIVTLKENASKILSDAWYSQKATSEEEERLRIVKAAAAIIREDIRTRIYDTTCYSEKELVSDCREQVPVTLHALMEGIMKSDNKKTITVEHAITASVRPRSFVSSLHVALGVHLHTHYASRQLIDLLSNLGVCASYKEVMQYEESLLRRPTEQDTDESAFVQFCFDNADFNVRTLDGLGTFHSMGGVKCVTPGYAVVPQTDIPRVLCTDKTSCASLEGKISPLSYVKQRSGLQKIIVEDVLSQDNLQSTIKSVERAKLQDLLWLAGAAFNENASPGWNGYMQEALSGESSFTVSRVLPLPFINLDPGNLNTIYTALMYAAEQAKDKSFPCFVTFDQPLYIKAVEMVAAAPDDSLLSHVIVRLGGFHLLMSFLGSVGHIMIGSGLEDLWATVYSPSSVTHMLTGHAYSRALRAHFLTQFAIGKLLLEILSQDHNLFKAELLSLHQSLLTHDTHIKDVDDSTVLQNMSVALHDLMMKCKDSSRTARLWLNYYDQVTLMRNFIRAERSGNWDLHIETVKCMLPYFHAAGHLPYAKSAHLYLQQMKILPTKMTSEDFSNFAHKGYFTIRRSDRFWSGIWTDMTIEQVLMRAMKSRGGLTRGRGLSDKTLARWIQATPLCARLSEAVEQFSGVRSATCDQHIELRESRITRDRKDSDTLFLWLKDHSPFECSSGKLISLSSGMIADTSVNCDNALDVGKNCLLSMVDKTFADIHLSRKQKVKNMASLNSSIKVRDEDVVIFCQQLFNRIVCVMKNENEMAYYMKYELAPQPPSLFDNVSMRKGNKAAMAECLEQLNKDAVCSTVSGTSTFVIDGGHLLHKVIWPRPATYKDILMCYVTYVKSNFKGPTVVVFDGYSNAATIKAPEHLRRLKKNKCADIIIQENNFITVSQSDFLGNSHNKTQLITLLKNYMLLSNIDVEQADGDADGLLVSTSISIANKGKQVVVVAEDTDVLVLLLANSCQNGLFMLKQGTAKRQDKVLNISTLRTRLGPLTHHLLFLHAVTGCDSTSALYGRGKKKAFGMLRKDKQMQSTVAVFNSPSATQAEVVEAGEKFIVSLYGGRLTDSLDTYRYFMYNKAIARLAVKSKFELASLPPTSAAARQHSLRVYLQVQLWLGRQIRSEDWGWHTVGDSLNPVTTLLPPAPDNLLNLISCNCRAGCQQRCECRRSGLECSAMCGQCRGIDCKNAPTRAEHDSDEDDDYE